jgi:small subunit ribosomal protein S17
MSDDETKKDVQDETDQGAGPAAEEDSSSSPEAAGEETTSTSPAPDSDSADDAPADDEGAPADPGPEAEESAVDGEAEGPSEEESESDSSTTSEGDESPEPDQGEQSPEDELPWKERRRLERSRQPHEAGPQLSVEERTAKRAEERRRRSEVRRRQRTKGRADGSGNGAGTPAAERVANAAKVRQGIVVSDKADKSITVRIDIVRRHPTYEKVVRRSRTLHAHDERNEAGEGDVVRVIETRPLSKTKRWRLVEVIEKAR